MQIQELLSHPISVFRVEFNDWVEVKGPYFDLFSDCVQIKYIHSKSNKYFIEQYSMAYLSTFTEQEFLKHIIFKDHWVLDKALYRMVLPYALKR